MKSLEVEYSERQTKSANNFWNPEMPIGIIASYMTSGGVRLKTEFHSLILSVSTTTTIFESQGRNENVGVHGTCSKTAE